MVKRSREKSAEAPRRLSWFMMVPPLSAFHSQTRARNSSRPMSRRPGCWRSIELALDDHLGGDAGVVGAGLPEHVLAAHALEADQDVLERVVERVADVERAGDVGRRDDDRDRALRPAWPLPRRQRRWPSATPRRCGPRRRRARRSCRSSGRPDGYGRGSGRNSARSKRGRGLEVNVSATVVGRHER